MTFDQLRALPAKSKVSVRVRAVKPLHTGTSSCSPIHVAKGAIGILTMRSRIGFIVDFDGESHHVFDYHTDKAEDEIEIVDDDRA